MRFPWILAGFTMALAHVLPIQASGTVAPSKNPPRCVSGLPNVRGLAELVQEIQSSLPPGSQGARIQARLGSIYWPCDKERATNLWVVSFTSLGTDETVRVSDKDRGIEMQQVGVYHALAGNTASSTKAFILRELVAKNKQSTAVSLLHSLPIQQSGVDELDLAVMPFLSRRDQDLAEAAVLIAKSEWTHSHLRSVQLFEEALFKFAHFPYSVAASYLELSSSDPAHSQMAISAVTRHFSSVVPDNPNARFRIDVYELIDLLGKVQTPQSQYAISFLEDQILKAFRSKPKWESFASDVEGKLCSLKTDHSKCAQAHADYRGVERASVPPTGAVSRLLNVAQVRTQALSIVDKDPRDAERIVASLDDAMDRAAVYTSLAEKGLRGRASYADRFMKLAVNLTRDAPNTVAALRNVVALLDLAPSFGRLTNTECMNAALRMIDTDSTEESSVFDGEVRRELTIRVLAAFAAQDTSAALDRIRNVADVNTRLECLLMAAEKLRSQGPTKQ